MAQIILDRQRADDAALEQARIARILVTQAIQTDNVEKEIPLNTGIANLGIKRVSLNSTSTPELVSHKREPDISFENEGTSHLDPSLLSSPPPPKHHYVPYSESESSTPDIATSKEIQVPSLSISHKITLPGDGSVKTPLFDILNLERIMQQQTQTTSAVKEVIALSGPEFTPNPDRLVIESNVSSSSDEKNSKAASSSIAEDLEFENTSSSDDDITTPLRSPAQITMTTPKSFPINPNMPALDEYRSSVGKKFVSTPEPKYSVQSPSSCIVNTQPPQMKIEKPKTVAREKKLSSPLSSFSDIAEIIHAKSLSSVSEYLDDFSSEHEEISSIKVPFRKPNSTQKRAEIYNGMTHDYSESSLDDSLSDFMVKLAQAKRHVNPARLQVKERKLKESQIAVDSLLSEKLKFTEWENNLRLEQERITRILDEVLMKSPKKSISRILDESQPKSPKKQTEVAKKIPNLNHKADSPIQREISKISRHVSDSSIKEEYEDSFESESIKEGFFSASSSLSSLPVVRTLPTRELETVIKSEVSSILDLTGAINVEQNLSSIKSELDDISSAYLNSEISSLQRIPSRLDTLEKSVDPNQSLPKHTDDDLYSAYSKSEVSSIVKPSMILEAKEKDVAPLANLSASISENVQIGPSVRHEEANVSSPDRTFFVLIFSGTY